MSTEQQLELAKRTIRRDVRYKKLRKAFRELPMFNIPIDQHHDEIDLLHKSRTIRSLQTSTTGFADKVICAALKDQSCRSRIVEICAEAYKVKATLDKTIKSYKDYVVIEYATQLKVISTKQERIMFIEGVLGEFYQYTSDLDVLIEHANIVIKDIDQAGYAIKNVIAAMQIVNRPEHTI